MQKENQDVSEEELIHYPVLNLQSGKTRPPRFCDLVVDKYKRREPYLEVKQGRYKKEIVPLESFYHQIEEILKKPL